MYLKPYLTCLVTLPVQVFLTCLRLFLLYLLLLLTYLWIFPIYLSYLLNETVLGIFETSVFYSIPDGFERLPTHLTLFLTCLRRPHEFLRLFQMYKRPFLMFLNLSSTWLRSFLTSSKHLRCIWDTSCSLKHLTDLFPACPYYFENFSELFERIPDVCETLSSLFLFLPDKFESLPGDSSCYIWEPTSCI